MKYMYYCENCKAPLVLETSGIIKIRDISFKWTCSMCKRLNNEGK